MSIFRIFQCEGEHVKKIQIFYRVIFIQTDLLKIIWEIFSLKNKWACDWVTGTLTNWSAKWTIILSSYFLSREKHFLPSVVFHRFRSFWKLPKIFFSILEVFSEMKTEHSYGYTDLSSSYTETVELSFFLYFRHFYSFVWVIKQLKDFLISNLAIVSFFLMHLSFSLL